MSEVDFYHVTLPKWANKKSYLCKKKLWTSFITDPVFGTLSAWKVGKVSAKVCRQHPSAITAKKTWKTTKMVSQQNTLFYLKNVKSTHFLKKDSKRVERSFTVDNTSKNPSFLVKTFCWFSQDDNLVTNQIQPNFCWYF